MGWKIVEIENAKYLKLFLDNLVIETDTQKITIPLSDIDTLITHNTYLMLSSRLLVEIANHNINFIICDDKHNPSCQLTPISGNYNSLKVFDKQLNWNYVFTGNLWKKIIIQKIINQAQTLLHFTNNEVIYNQIIELSNEVKDFDQTNREGHAAKLYWHYLIDKDFSRTNDCFLNTLLNYGYAVLRSMITRSIIKKGLDPRKSLYHHSFNNFFALASDFIEVFRFCVDHLVYLIKDQYSNINDAKTKLLQLMGNYKLLYNGKGLFINNAVDDFVDHVINQSEFPTIKILWEQSTLNQCE